MTPPTPPDALAPLPQRSRGELASPERLAVARQALADAETLPDVTRLADQAQAMRVLARKSALGREAQNEWAAYRLDAERKAGTLLRELAEGGGLAKGHRYGAGADGPSAPAPTLVELGIAPTPEAAQQRSSRWQALAAIPEAAYERYKAEARANEEEITQAAALRLADQYRGWSGRELELLDRLQDGEIVVLSFRDDTKIIEWAEAKGLFVRIDRRTDWGNPFEMPADGDRETVIANYEGHYLPHKPSLLGRLGELRGKALGCWCAPEPCHGDVLKDWSESGRIG